MTQEELRKSISNFDWNMRQWMKKIGELIEDEKPLALVFPTYSFR